MSSDRQTKKVRSADGVVLDLRLLGGDGPDLLISHATGFHGRVYAPLAACLSGRFRVWTFDYRGHGSSEPSPSGDYNWTAMTADAAACAAALESDCLYGFGHSMGGATLLAAENDRPGTFAGLFVYEPIILPPGWFAQPEDNRMSGAARNRREVFDSRASALLRYASRPPLNVLRADALAAYVQYGFVDIHDGRVRLACRAETEARCFEGGGDIVPDSVAAVETSTTVAVGSDFDQSDITLINITHMAAAVADKLSAGSFVQFEHLGHLGPLEAPTVVAARITEHLL